MKKGLAILTILITISIASAQELFPIGHNASEIFPGTFAANGTFVFPENVSITNTFTAGNASISGVLSATGGIVSTTPIGLSSGGTGTSLTATNGGIVYSGTTSLAISTVGITGQCLKSTGAGIPSWGACTPGAPTIGAGTTGQTTFWFNSTHVTGDNSFFWNNSLKRLGIGTITPTHKLNVIGKGNITDTLIIGNSFINSTHASIGSLTIPTIPGVQGGIVIQNGGLALNDTNPAIALVSNAATQKGGISFFNNSLDETWAIEVTNKNLSIVENDTTTRLKILKGGNIGIGTTTPTELLHIKSPKDANISIDSALGNNSFIKFSEDGTQKTLIGYVSELGAWGIVPSLADTTKSIILNMSNGNVGIGTTKPQATLDITHANDATAEEQTLRIGVRDTTLNEFYTLGRKSSDGSLVFKNHQSGTGGYRFITNTSNTFNERLTILNNGNIGIGTTTPSQKLHVNGSANITETLHASNISSNSPLQLQTQGTTRIYLDGTTGNIGIGTTTPENKLDVEGALVIGTTYSGTSVAPSNGLLVEGNVGIGTTSPTQKLNVIGDVNITGNLTVGTGTMKITNNGLVFPDASVQTTAAAIEMDSGVILDQEQLPALNGVDQTTLSANITATATTIPLTDASNFPTSGTITLINSGPERSSLSLFPGPTGSVTGGTSIYSDGNKGFLGTSDTLGDGSANYSSFEKITYTGKSGNTLTGATRGAKGTTAINHTKGDRVWNGQVSVIIAPAITAVEVSGGISSNANTFCYLQGNATVQCLSKASFGDRFEALASYLQIGIPNS